MSETKRHQGALLATLAGMIDRVRAPRGDVSLRPDERLDGKNVLVTGASRGLGRAIARGLARLGANVHVAVRSLADETVADVRAQGGGGTVTAWPLDLERLDSVDGLAKALAEANVQLDVVVLNAGVVPLGSRTTPHGLDMMLQVNALSNIRLVDRLLAERVLVPADPAPRLVVVGSEAHRSSEPIDWTSLATPRTYTTSQVVSEYGRTKLVLHTWVVELSRRLAGPGPHVEIHHLCPGAIASSIAREAPTWAKPLLDLTFKLFFQSPDVAAKPVLYLAASRAVAGQTGVYLHMTQRKEPAALCLEPSQGAACWLAGHEVLAQVDFHQHRSGA